MVNLITTCTDFINLARDGFLAIFNSYFNMNLQDVADVLNVGTIPPPLDVYADMSVAVFTVGSGIVVVMCYNFIKWVVGLITGS